MSTPINHETLAISRLATEYREATKLIQYIQSLLLEANNLEEVFADIIESRWLNNAVGIQLDILGSIVGQTRELIDAETFAYFGFTPFISAQSFGTLSDPGIGGRFLMLGQPTSGFRLLDDEEYRAFIKARITRNSTRSTVQEIIDLVRFLVDVNFVAISEGATSYSVAIGKILTLNEKALITTDNIIPKTAGVTVLYVEFNPADFFAFGGVFGGAGLGDFNFPVLGGSFGSAI